MENKRTEGWCIYRKTPLQKKAPAKKNKKKNKNYNNKLQDAKHTCCCTAIREHRETVATFLCVCVRCRVQQRGMTASLLCDYTPTNLGEHQVRLGKKKDACCPEVLSRQSVQKNVPSLAMGGAFNRDERLTQMSLMLCNCGGKTQRAAFIIGTKKTYRQEVNVIFFLSFLIAQV